MLSCVRLDNTHHASQFRCFAEQRGAVELLRGSAAILEGVKNADGIELGIRFPHEPLDVLLAVPAIIIATVGYDQQGSFSGVCPSHLTESQINGIQQGGLALRRASEHAALQVFDIGSEPTQEVSAL